VPALADALNDHEPLVRGHAAWALGRIGSSAAIAALQQKLLSEDDAEVKSEIEEALRDSQGIESHP
jgi:epoxyqueuosine reductase